MGFDLVVQEFSGCIYWYLLDSILIVNLVSCSIQDGSFVTQSGSFVSQSDSFVTQDGSFVTQGGSFVTVYCMSIFVARSNGR